MSAERPRHAKSLLALYYQLVFVVTAALLALHTLTHVVVATAGGKGTTAVLGLEAGIALLAVSATEVERRRRPGPSSLPDLFLLGIALLQVALCLSTGGLASPYFPTVVMSGAFAGLTLAPFRAALVAASAAALYAIGLWGEGPARVEGSATEAATATVVHVAFLALATILAARVARRQRDTVAALEVQSKRDPLTALENRRGFLQKMTSELARAERFSWPISMLIIDLDHFKALNDEHGHAVGDMVLVEAAALLRETVGTIDHLARIGGEEFAVAAVAAEPHHGRDLAERLLRAFRTRTWGSIRPGLRVTCSIGIAVLEPGRRRDASVEAVLSRLMQRADRALYRVKQNGRNGYYVSEEAQAAPAASVATLAPPR